MAETLLDAAFRDSEGFAQIVVGDFVPNADGKPKLKIAKMPFFAWPAAREEMLGFVEAHADRDVYFGTSLFNRQKRSVDTATETNIIYVDADTCHPDVFLVKPSLVVTTSPGRYQCYWYLDAAVPAIEAAEVAHKMCVRHADDACDPSGWTPAKLMRVPGTSHRKTETAYEVTSEDTGLRYTFDEVLEPYRNVEVSSVLKVEETDLPTDLPELYTTVNRLGAEEFALFQYEPTDADDWSSLRWKLAQGMFHAGFAAPEVFVVLGNTKFNKYARDNRPEADLWREVQKARTVYKHEIDQFADDLAPEKLPDNLAPEFLTLSERLSLSTTFTDEFEDWVHSRSPLASRKYARFVSFFVLANVLGGYAYIEPQMGRMNLNIWGLMLGPSSELKKTTVVSLARGLQKVWERRLPDEQKGFDIGSDFTPEGLNRRLSERDGLVSFIHRDEISGFFHETLQKSYLAGSVERLTALYDGEVMRTMRASANTSQTQDATTILNFLGLGIEAHTAEVLTSQHFQSGFLPRFLWCVDDAPDWTPSRETIGQGTKRLTNDDDPVIKTFCNRFSKIRHKWDTAPGTAKPIYLTEEALRRLNQYALDTKYLIQGDDKEPLLEPSRVRMLWAVWKVAALLAMYDYSEQIELDHILYAIRESEIWFSDMTRMAENVTATGHERQMGEIMEWATTVPAPIAPARIFRKFSHLRKAELEEHLATLRAQGRLVYTKDGGYEPRV